MTLLGTLLLYGPAWVYWAIYASIPGYFLSILVSAMLLLRAKRNDQPGPLYIVLTICGGWLAGFLALAVDDGWSSWLELLPNLAPICGIGLALWLLQQLRHQPDTDQGTT